MDEDDERYLRALKADDWDDPVVREAARLFAPLVQESDRGCVLVAAALIDDALERLLRAQFSRDGAIIAEVIDPLFRDLGGLSSTALKERLAYALGLIGPQTLRQLKGIRKLRNRFAHSSTVVSLEHGDIEFLRGAMSPQQEKFCRATVLAMTEFVPENTPLPGLNLTRVRFSTSIIMVRSWIEAAIRRLDLQAAVAARQTPLSR
jgi:DNA-binding MltR family transcriptional regulator